jgi:heptosyltransferase-3
MESEVGSKRTEGKKQSFRVLKQIRQLSSFYKDEYRKHLFKSKVSYLINYYKLLYISYLNRKNGIVAISLIEHIGDIIANEPISREVRRKHPESTIIWFVRKPYRDLLKYNPAINKVYNVFCLTTWILIRNKFAFEAVYDLQFNGRACSICQRSLIKENVVDSVNGTNYLNYGGLLKAVCLHNKIEVLDTTPQMYIPAKIISGIEQFIPKEKYIVIHCVSNESIKDWDADKWNKFVFTIIDEYKIHVVEIGSVSKLKTVSDNYLNLCGKLSILQSAAVIKRAVLFIGIDSGPAHMANATGTPGIILIGEYYFGMNNYNPYTGNYGSLKKCRLIHSYSSVKEISVESVLQNFDSLLKEASLIS